MNKKGQKFRKSLGFAIAGLIYTLRTQRNMGIHLIIALGVFLAAFIFRISTVEFLLLTLVIVLVMVLEMVNTAIETVVDMYTLEYSPRAKIAKDVAAGAVLLASAGAVLIGIIIFGPKIWVLLQ